MIYPENIYGVTPITESRHDYDLRFRPPDKEDAAGILRLVHGLGVLDVNSAYAYMLIGEHHWATSVVTELGGELVGFITAYILPSHPDVVFVWQVGVDKAGRGRGLATRMLFEILNRGACADVRYLETTIGTSNEASKALFRGLARRLNTGIEESDLFTSELFGDFEGEDHETEILFRIGPFDSEAIRGATV